MNSLVHASAHKTAGAMLREARTAQGVHLAALATAIKVPARKLELLEADRYGELPDPTFVRGLAKAVCRSLRVDDAPVLALLPRFTTDGGRLTHVANGLNEPFNGGSGHRVAPELPGLAAPALWGAAVLLVAAGAVYLWPYLQPQGWSSSAKAHVNAAPSLPLDTAAPAAGLPAAASTTAVPPGNNQVAEPVGSAPAGVPVQAATSPNPN